jgi:serine phosphatase RsbU (regulator of sigma subunit)
MNPARSSNEKRASQSTIAGIVAFLAVEAYYSPARTIGGDFGVVFPQGDDSLSIVLSDVSGHGVGSALMANRIYSETLHAL